MVTSGRLLADVQGAVHDAACGALDSHAGDDDVVQGLGGVIQIGYMVMTPEGWPMRTVCWPGLRATSSWTRVPGTNAATLMEEALVSGQAL